MTRYEQVVTHEFGHAVVAIELGGIVTQVKVWRSPSVRGETWFMLPPAATPMDEATAAMGGWGATPDRWPIDDGDRALAFVGEAGMSEAMRRAREIVLERWVQVEELTGLFLAQDLTGVASMLRAMAA